MDPGDVVLVATEKWGGTAHWQFRTVYLGSDEHGDWLGAAAGTLNARPGKEFVCPVDAVTLVPPTHATERGHLATFYADGFWCGTYVDITTPARWDTGDGVPVLRCADLDLDVVRAQDGRVYVDDEDEFAEHQVSLAYPPHVVAGAVRSCAAVHEAVLAGLPPYDGPTPAAWLTKQREVTGAR